MAKADGYYASVRTLVVDNYTPWRNYARSILQARLGFCVVAEVGDGLEALQKALELKPDLILLDIGLPSLDGLQVAIRILQVAPETRIIFLTCNCDSDIVLAAFRTGAHGYVLKTDAGNELLVAMDTVMGGNKFVCSGIKRGDFGHTNYS